MTTGMATIAGTVMVLYASILSGVIPNIMGHILTASIISVPAAVTIAKIMVPETEKVTTGRVVISQDAVSSMLIITYAMCGFANPGSLGIMIGGLGTMAPERREDIVSLGFKSIVAGTMATCMTGAVVGLIG